MNSQPPRPLRVPDEGGSGMIDGGDLLAIVRRRALLVLLVAGITTSAAFGFVRLWPPVYKSTATLMVLTREEGDDNSPAPNPAQDEIIVNSQLEQLRSRELAHRVVRNLGLLDDVSFTPEAKPGAAAKPTADAEERAIARLKDRVAIGRVNKSNLITVAASANTPEMAAKLANRYAMLHMEQQRKGRLDANRELLGRLEPRVEVLREQLVAADRAVADFRRAQGMIGPLEGIETSHIGSLGGSLSDARSRVAETAARARLAEPAQDLTGSSSPLLEELRRQSSELRRKVAEMSAFYGPAYPELVNTQAQLAEVERRLKEESQRIDRELDAAVAISTARASRINNDLASARASSMRQRSASVTLMDLERRAEAVRELYMATLAQQQKLSTQSGMIRVPLRIVARATPPLEPVFPRPRETVAVALLGGLAMGVLLALVLELLDKRLRSARQVRNATGLGTLAMLPQLPATAASRPAQLLAEQAASPAAESLRSLYIELERRAAGMHRQTVLVTSAVTGEGKSTVSVGIAASAAALWRRAVVLDVDLRRPDVLPSLGVDGSGPDLRAYLNGECTLDDALKPVPNSPRLFALGVGTACDDPLPLLTSPKLEELLQTLRAKFQIIVLNAPPILAVSDAKLLQRYATQTLIVVRWNRTRSDALQAALATFGTEVTGAVINGVDYKEHARQRHGDAVQHYMACTSYFGDYGAEVAR